MRTAKVLKYLTYGVFIFGFYFTIKFFNPYSLEFWITLFVTFVLWFILRIIANIGQLIYDIKAELIRSLANIERAIYHSNAILKEIRDLTGSGREKNKID